MCTSSSVAGVLLARLCTSASTIAWSLAFPLFPRFRPLPLFLEVGRDTRDCDLPSFCSESAIKKMSDYELVVDRFQQRINLGPVHFSSSRCDKRGCRVNQSKARKSNRCLPNVRKLATGVKFLQQELKSRTDQKTGSQPTNDSES